MREKYVEERFPRWFEFGRRSDGSGVDISNGVKDVAEGVSVESAKSLIDEHNAAISMLCMLALKLDEASTESFKALWYGSAREGHSDG